MCGNAMGGNDGIHRSCSRREGPLKRQPAVQCQIEITADIMAAAEWLAFAVQEYFAHTNTNNHGN